MVERLKLLLGVVVWVEIVFGYKKESEESFLHTHIYS
jgi:hypothetical protein